jgi:hypothetical protein
MIVSIVPSNKVLLSSLCAPNTKAILVRIGVATDYRWLLYHTQFYSEVYVGYLKKASSR